jgi:uncharacterized protein YdgA (DUF945 family)
MGVRVGIGLGAVLVLLGIGSCVSGVVLERAYERIIDEASAASEGSWEIEGEYRRGWLSSSARTRLTIADEQGGEPLVVPLEHDVVHGLVPLGMLARGGSPFDVLVGRVVTEHHLDAERLPRFAEALKGRPFLQATTRIGVTGMVDVELHSPSFVLDDGSFESEGMVGDVRLSLSDGRGQGAVRVGVLHLRDGEGVALIDGGKLSFESEPGQGGEGAASSRVSGVLELGAVSLEGEGGRARIAPARLRFSGESGEGATIAGQTELELSEVEAHPAQGRSLVLRGLELLEVREQSTPDARRDFRADLSFQALELGDERYGPGELQGAIRNIDAQAFEALQEAAAAVEAAGDDEQAKMQAQMALMGGQLPAFLAPSPEIALEKLHLVGESGALDASIRLGVDGSDPSMLGNPFMLLTKVQAAAKLDSPGPMLEALLDGYYERTLREEQPELDAEALGVLARETRAATLEKLLADGTLVRKGDRYAFEARLEEGLPIINGAPADPTFLMGIVPGF